MNVLFLIGNGFDINIGLNTRFKDALNTYLKDQNDDLRIQKFKKDISQDFENWSDFEKQMGIYTENFTQQNIEDYYFCINNFRESLAKHLKDQELRINYNANKEDIISIFGKSIIEFYNGLILTSQNRIKSIVNLNEQILYNFMTFNYTNILEHCLEILKTEMKPFNPNRPNDHINKILHIHGTTEENLILGVDNIEQIKNKELLDEEKLHWTIAKPIINRELGNQTDREGASLINNSRIICIFGLSLGETDKSWWQSIGQWLQDTNRHLVIFDKVPKWNHLHPVESIEKRKALSKKFFLSADITKNQNAYMDRIHIGFNTDMFKLDLTKK
ncbi:MAG: bacteriophage abortive infection AbiH family protein [Candidatus Symbiothrix sp.]|jgi:hypothetical protein|nr:bacteriophage abortive infection AbiH family protein [Candidatus Symbiothrix sp.]